MKTLIAVSVAFVAGSGLGWPVHASPADLTSAKALYASASYEEALATLSALTEPPDDPQVEQYRALCFLALGRANEAEQSIEQLVLHNPRYVVSGDEVSPRLVDLYRGVRRRTLPVLAKDLYAKAKRAYDSNQLDAARAQFTQLVTIVSDSDLGEQESAVADMKQLGEGFLKLIEAALVRDKPIVTQASAAPPAASGPTVQTAPVLTPSAEAESAAPPVAAADPNRIYTVSDRDVVPPKEIERRMPIWAPSGDVLRRMTLTGLLVVVIDEHGDVESVTLDEPMSPSYDDDLLAAARRWRFHPAMKNGQPVKYFKEIRIVLRPPTQ